MKPIWLAPVMVLALGAGLTSYVMAPAVSEPREDRNFTSTREVDALKVDSDASLWVSTGGGVLQLKDGAWTKYESPPVEFPLEKPKVTFRGQIVTVSLDGLQLGSGASAKPVPMPPSSGTHISAVLVRDKVLWAAVFGDGIWAWDGAKWAQQDLKMPVQAREITALAQWPPGSVWVGTRRQGVWKYIRGVWTQHLQPDEPYAHNVQNLASFGGKVWASTLEDGLVVWNAGQWEHVRYGQLSSNAPRQLVVFKGRLFVRHSNETVDAFDGISWKRNVFPKLPRKQIISLAADTERLYLGQWGGWSEWDGSAFVHHLRHPELQIVPLQQLYPDEVGKSLWLGTVNRGLFQWNFQRKTLSRYDERHGLPDDWITSLGRNGQEMFAGTFGGGLVWRREGTTNWRNTPELAQLGITAVAPDGPNQTWIGTRYGLYSRDDKGVSRSWKDKFSPPFREVQAILPVNDGIWLGTRNGLLYRKRTSSSFSEA